MISRIYRFCGSLQLAVFVILGLALSLALATFYESAYGTKAVQANVYQTAWFSGLLILLGINIFCVAAQRYPWKKHQTGFVLAHAGILVLLFGSALTRNFGIDGSLALNESETSNIITLDEPQFEIWDRASNRWLLRRNLRQNDIKPGLLLEWGEQGLGLVVQEFIPKAVAERLYVSTEQTHAPAAIQIEITSRATGIRSEQWLLANDPDAGHATMGLAQISFAQGALAKSTSKSKPHDGTDNSLHFLLTPDGTLRYKLSSRLLGQSSGVISTNKSVTTGWRDFEFRVLKSIPHAQESFRYTNASNNVNDDAPSAIRLETTIDRTPVWLGYGDSITARVRGRELLFRYGPRYIALPFAIRLKTFQMGKYPGTDRAMTYTSLVNVLDADKTALQTEFSKTITMNEPLTYRNFTFYQASFQQTEKGYVSILSVNRDPGRIAKYLGSLLIVAGIIIMYTLRFRKN